VIRAGVGTRGVTLIEAKRSAGKRKGRRPEAAGRRIGRPTCHCRRRAPHLPAVGPISAAKRQLRRIALGVVDQWGPVMPETARRARHDLLAKTDQAIQARALDQLKPAVVLLDTMDQWIRERRRAFESNIFRATIVSLNEAELVQLTGERDLVGAARLLVGRGPRAVIAKRGAGGATLITRNVAYALPAYAITPIDPTGAGDALAGAFIGRLAQHGGADDAALRDALAAGMAAASFAVASFGVDALAAATIDELTSRAAWLADHGGTAEAARPYEGR